MSAISCIIVHSTAVKTVFELQMLTSVAKKVKSQPHGEDAGKVRASPMFEGFVL